jgi:S-adenosylmethionine decarboxylase
LLVELYGCDGHRLDDPEYLKSRGVAAAQSMGATVVAAHAHRFQPVGVSVIVVLAESHLAIHTWPERATASLDIFVCNPGMNPHQAKRFLIESLVASDVAEMEVRRGDLHHEPRPDWQFAGSNQGD